MRTPNAATSYAGMAFGAVRSPIIAPRFDRRASVSRSAAFGLLSGYYRNRIRPGAGRPVRHPHAIPAVVLAVALVPVLKGDPTSGADRMDFHLRSWCIALAIVAVPLVARITRRHAMAWAQREFVTAPGPRGVQRPAILFREILPNVLPAMVYIALLGLAITLVAEGSLAILGASLDPPETTWGIMINDGRADMEEAPFLIFIPIVAIFLTVLSLNFLGDAIRSRFDVRESAL